MSAASSNVIETDYAAETAQLTKNMMLNKISLSLSSFSSFLPMGIGGESKGPQIFSSMIKSETFFNELSKIEIGVDDSGVLIFDYISNYRNETSSDNLQLERYRNYKFLKFLISCNNVCFRIYFDNSSHIII